MLKFICDNSYDSICDGPETSNVLSTWLHGAKDIDRQVGATSGLRTQEDNANEDILDVHESDDQESNFEVAEDVISSMLCKNNPQEGAHRCKDYGKVLHVLPECSIALEDEEGGYGQKRLSNV
ncbi:Protein of unknown function [Gryllus bimaculatus]|nr:Protein of unknown function [Gryllus bimaculatus]